jgi:NADPH:quinone reductase-like Zn-dependent oxidoreductase
MGGSSATRTLAIQFAKLSGYKVVTTCSPKNFELVQVLGADVVLNYVSYLPSPCWLRVQPTITKSLNSI